MVAQAEHIPVHLGAMPASVAAVHRAAIPRPRTSSSSTIRTPAERTCRTSPSSRAPSSASRPRARTMPMSAAAVPGSMPADSRVLSEEGVVIPPTRLDDRTLDALVAQMRNPDERRGDLRAQLGAQRLACARIAELCARQGRDRSYGGDGRARRVLRAPSSAPGSRRCRTGATRPTELLETADGRARAACRRHGRRRRARDRLRRHGPAVRRQSQLPARSHASRPAVRRPLPDRPRRAGLGRGARTGDRPRAGGLPRERADARRPSRPERRDLEPDRRPALPSVRTGACRSRRRDRGR